MKIANTLKKCRAATMSDVIIGMIILFLFTGIVTAGFTRIYQNNLFIRMDAYSVYYAIKIMEDIDRLPYDDVTVNLNIGIKDRYGIIDPYNATILITEDERTNEVVKKITVRVEYNAMGTDKLFTVEKLKLNEK